MLKIMSSILRQLNSDSANHKTRKAHEDKYPAKCLAYEAQYRGLIVKENYYRMWLKVDLNPCQSIASPECLKP